MPRDGVADGACCVLLADRPSKGTAIDKEYLSDCRMASFKGRATPTPLRRGRPPDGSGFAVNPRARIEAFCSTVETVSPIVAHQIQLVGVEFDVRKQHEFRRHQIAASLVSMVLQDAIHVQTL